MKHKQHLMLSLGLAGLFFTAAGCLTSISHRAFAEDKKPAVTMLSGASVRKDGEMPGLKFSANIEDYDAEAQYGMLILPEEVMDKYTFNNDYISVLDADKNAAGKYINQICHPYSTGETSWRISLSLVNILPQNYTQSFTGIAYELKDEGYSYAEIDRWNNSRSVSMVAQLALEYETNLTGEQRKNLDTYANPGAGIDKSEYMGNAIEELVGTNYSYTDYVAAIDIDKLSESAPMSMITKKSYPGGTTISFDAYKESGTKEGTWWGICWTTDSSDVDLYKWTTGNGKTFSVTDETWTHCTATLPEDEKEYYVYFVGAKGEWNGKKLHLDNFSMAGEVDAFQSLSGGLFNVDENISLANNGNVFAIPSENGSDYCVMLDVAKQGEVSRLYTGQSYPAGTQVSFRYFISEDATMTWARFSRINVHSSDIYAGDFSLLNSEKGVWHTFTQTVSEDNMYYHIVSEAGKSGKLYIDDFTIELPDGTTLRDGVEEPLGTGLLTGDKAAVRREGIPADKPSALGIIGNAIGGNEKIAVVTKVPYSSISEITFDAKASADFGADRWGLGLTSAKGTYNYYTPFASAELDKTANEWVSYKYLFHPGVYNDYVKVFRKTSGDNEYTQIKENNVSGFNVSNAYYIYLQICPGSGVNVPSTVLSVDNFCIKTKDGTIYTDDFSLDATAGLFEEATTTDGLVHCEGVSDGSVNYAFNSLLCEGKISEVINSGGYSYFTSVNSVNVGDLPATTLILEGKISYEISGEKEFAVALSYGSAMAGYLYANNSVLALYNGEQKDNEIYVNAVQTLYLAVTAGGRVFVKTDTDGNYVYMGMVATVSGIKIVGFGGTGFVKFNEISIKTYSKVKEPTYQSEEHINIVAYSSVPASLMNDEQFEKLSSAGFTKALGLLEGRVGLSENMTEEEIRGKLNDLYAQVNKDAEKALSLAEKYNIEYYVFNELLYNIERYTNISAADYVKILLENAPYTESMAYAGNFLADEPTADELSALTEAYNAYKAAGGKEAFINLLPYEGESGIGALWNKGWKNYQTYISEYVKNIGKKAGYISFDHYAFLTDSIGAYHLQNLEYIASMAKENDIELRTFVWALAKDSEKHRAVTSVDDLRFQLNSALCFGAKQISYFMYSCNTDTEDSTTGLINSKTGAESAVYAFAKQANNEIHSFEKAYLNFEWDSFYTMGTCSQFSNIQGTAKKSERMATISSSGNILIGNFKDKDNLYDYDAADGFMVMNYADPAKELSASDVTITFNNATRAIVYLNGTRTVVNLSAGSFTLSLTAGNGAFIIPLTDVK